MNAQPQTQDLEPAQKKTPITRYLFVVGLLLYFGVVWYLGWRDVGDIFLSARFELVAATFALITAGTWLRAWKWRYVLGNQTNAITLYFISKAAGNWSPGRLGEFSPMVMQRYRTPKMGAWILLDRLIEIAVTLILGIAGLGLLHILNTPTFVLVAVGTTLASALSFYLVTRRDLFLWLSGKTREESWAHKLAMLLAAVSSEFFSFGRSLPVVVIITIITKCGDLLGVLLLFVACGFNPGFWLVATAKCALAIVSFVPLTPAATGVPHATQAWLMNEVAQIPYEGLVAAIGLEVVILSISFWTSFGLAGGSRLLKKASKP